MDVPRARARLGSARVAELATVRSDGTAHVVPVCFALLDDTVVTAVDAKPKSTAALRRLDNVRANPHASLLVHEYADDWAKLWWVRVDGPAEVVSEGARRIEAIEALVAKYRQYQDTPPPGPVIALTITRWASWSPT
jgi:PPOX class probable F420-dependent enzyme